MFARMLGHIDHLCCRFDPRKRGPFDCFRLSDKGYNRPVMIGVAAGIQDMDWRSLLHRFDNRLDNLGTASFTKIGDTLNKWSFHGANDVRPLSGWFKFIIHTRVLLPHWVIFVKIGCEVGAVAWRNSVARLRERVVPSIILIYFCGDWWGPSIMSTVDDVKARLDIVDVVSGYVNLIKAGRNYKALCPFHQERTPSFIVFPDTQTWRCFGACGEGGDIFGFVMRAEGWDFSEALRELAKRAGVEVASYTPETTEQQAQSDRLRDLLEEAARFFHTQLLKSPAGQIARDYLQRRYLDEQTIEDFALGYAPHDWHQATHHLQLEGYTQDEIIETGIAIHSEEKKSVYDRFRHRLMIPIRDGRGRTVGFGARALNKDDNPKYLNSPQGPLFDKSRLLFGLDMARRSIRETETVVVVEGYMDVMQAHQAGFTNVVAQMGTALTEPQLHQLDKYASRLILALDPDAAGVHATMRGLDVARQTLNDEKRVSFDPQGMMRYTGMLELDLRVVSLPGEQDPDELIHDNPEAWEQLIASAIPVADYVIQQGTAHLAHNASMQEREAVARELLPILTATESDLQRNGNIQALARRVRIDERILIQWSRQRQAAETRPQLRLKEQRRLAGRPVLPTIPAFSGPPGQSPPREGFCLALLIQQPDRLYAANRKLRQLQGQDETLAEVLGPLGAR